MSERYIPCQEDIKPQETASDEQPDVSNFKDAQENHPSWLPTMVQTATMIAHEEFHPGSFSREQLENAHKMMNWFNLEISVLSDNSTMGLYQLGRLLAKLHI